MSGFHQTIVFGRLGSDPEVKYTQGGTAVASFSIATSRRRKVRGGDDYEEVTEWHRCKAFGKQAEVIGEHVRKGDMLFVEGRNEAWKASGDSKASGVDVMVELFEFAGRGGGGAGTGQDRPQRSPAAAAPRGATRGPTQPRGAPAASQSQPGDFADDDIPF